MGRGGHATANAVFPESLVRGRRSVEGRGTHHQIDALVSPLHSHAFIYPIRLAVEAKCEKNAVSLKTVRSAVGTLFDLNQNYFAQRLAGNREVRVQRFNYHGALFAVNGYSQDAEQFAMAHQLFLIDYSHVASMRGVVDALLGLELEDFDEVLRTNRRGNLAEIRRGFRSVLEEQRISRDGGIFSERGKGNVRTRLLPSLQALHGSYYGMIEGIYPIHLVSRQRMPVQLIREGVIQCEVRVSEDEQTWAFEPSEFARGDPNFFHLEFTIPEFISKILNTRTEEYGEREGPPRWLRIANVKPRFLRFIDVTAVDDGQLVPFRLALDQNWLNNYVTGRREMTARRTRRESSSLKRLMSLPDFASLRFLFANNRVNSRY
jgi:hypothetical protein